MALNPIAAGLRNMSKSNIKVQLSIPPGATLDEVADQLVAAGMRDAKGEVPAFLLVEEPPEVTRSTDPRRPKRTSRPPERATRRKR